MSLGVGVIGLGFMGQTHIRAYASAGARLLAVLDPSESRRTGLLEAKGNIADQPPEVLFDPKAINATDSLPEFLATPDMSVVSVCTPTDTHVEVATAALRAGKHVLVEKPVALTTAAVRHLRDEALRCDRICMPAMCMRFWPAWAWVKQAIDERKYGDLLAMRLERIGSRPGWGAGFYTDDARCGGALFDLHIHDTDFVIHCLGLPSAVHTVGTARHLTTLYQFDSRSMHISARGGWLQSPSVPFTMRLQVECEHAVLDFDLGRSAEFQVWTSQGETLTPELPSYHGWEGEVRALLEALGHGSTTAPTSLDDAVRVTAVLEAERASMDSNAPHPVVVE